MLTLQLLSFVAAPPALMLLIFLAYHRPQKLDMVLALRIRS